MRSTENIASHINPLNIFIIYHDIFVPLVTVVNYH